MEGSLRLSVTPLIIKLNLVVERRRDSSTHPHPDSASLVGNEASVGMTGMGCLVIREKILTVPQPLLHHTAPTHFSLHYHLNNPFKNSKIFCHQVNFCACAPATRVSLGPNATPVPS